jgi:hypothetical protein
MKSRQLLFRIALTTLGLAVGSAACGPRISLDDANKELQKVVKAESRQDMVQFSSDADLDSYFKKLREAQEARDRAARSGWSGLAKKMSSADATATPAAAPPMEESEGEAASSDDDGITNNQEAGVDEGGIVKTRGNHLVVLRRGRLFTVNIGDKALVPISKIDVSPAPGHDAWYDEMLIHDDTIIVVGYSYQAGATEIGMFEIDRRGKLSRKDTFFLRSNDYYSSRNYASRLLGDKLVFYMPWYLGAYGWDADHPNLPGMMKYREGTSYDDWDVVMKSTDIYRPVQPTQDPVLHTVVTCDLGRGMDCHAQGVIGPYGRNFYVSQNAVYVWVHDGGYGGGYGFGEDADDKRDGVRQPPAVVYRLSMSGGKPGAVRTFGAPVDQFSFKESEGVLNVMVRAESEGDMMWGPEFAYGDAAMLRMPTSAFDKGVVSSKPEAYVDLPEPKGDGYTFQNRFVGDYLLYGNGSGWGYADDARNGMVYAHPFRDPNGRTKAVPLPHGIDRIEALGRDAVVVGSDGSNLHFSSLELGRHPEVASRYVQANANQGETRSHGFFFKPTARGEGMLGLPIRRGSAPGYEHLMYGSAELLYLSVDNLRFDRLGALASDPNAGENDQCTVSCVDWYGNARPIFYKDRVFALLGYELVEGTVSQGALRELRRTNMLDLIQPPQPPQLVQ